ncbi:CHAT domain-containing protein [Spirulina sp. CS-785/01]|uniref:CHAT domain-containing tetratricopeptide repeat protein n=1 Tax=Spirulina sp. CS-785/01 TaxID=3021716 RepID=UPI00232AE67D|nr:CHAT domain-containing protein [Spirulina sp. CS-785/01]MDB9315786.1 CHAT domain-containing protein [Spirulina sp. CS-785/01]
MKTNAFSLLLSLVVLGSSALPGVTQGAEIRRSYEQVLEGFPTMLEQAEESGNRKAVSQALYSAAIAYQYFGEFEKALPLYEEALQIAREVNDLAWERSILHSFSSLKSKLGDLHGINFLEEQLAQARTPERRKMLLHVLGYSYTTDLNSVRALEVWQEYLTLVDPREAPQDYLAAVYSLASVYQINRQFGKGIAVIEEAIPVIQNSEIREQVSGLHLMLGIIRYQRRQPEAALVDLQNAVALASDNYQKVAYLEAVAEFYNAEQEYEKALAVQQQRWELVQEFEALNQGMVLDDLSASYFGLGDLAQALEWQKQALAKYKAENHSLAVASERVGYLLWRMGRAKQAEPYLREAIEAYEQDRQASLQNTNILPMSRDRLNQIQFESSVDAYRLLQRVLIEQNRFQDALEVSEQGRTKALTELMVSRFALNPEEVQATALSWSEMQQIAQREKTTLVQYTIVYEYGRLYRYNFFPKPPPPSQELLIWVVHPDGTMDFRQVTVEQPIEELVKEARQGIYLASRRPNAEVAPLQALHGVLIEPIADLLPTDPNATVTFIPQDMLFLVPFPALLDAQGTAFIEQHTPITVPSIQVLGLARQVREMLTPQEEMLIVGNPTMPTVSLIPGQPPEQLETLSGAEKEANAIAQLLNTQPLLGSDATKPQVKQRMEEAKYIHFATHGLLDEFSGYLSALAFAPTANDNGLLSTREVFQLDLNAELAVLSACDTGRGSKTLFGDGVVGFSRSFIGAGVPSLVVSLWAIPDQPTATLMVEFYQNLEQGQNKAQALREAMLTTRQQYPSPRDWAAFTLMGVAE